MNGYGIMGYLFDRCSTPCRGRITCVHSCRRYLGYQFRIVLWLFQLICAVYMLQVPTSSSNEQWPRFTDPHLAHHHSFTLAHDFPLNIDSHSVAYSGNRSEGHIYEEVGPPSQSGAPPYLNAEMLEAHQLHQQRLHQQQLGSLCSMCSVRCSPQGVVPRAPTLPSLPPMCHCGSSRPMSPLCHHGSISHPTTSNTLNCNGCAPRCLAHQNPQTLQNSGTAPVHTTNCLHGFTNQRYNPPPHDSDHNHEHQNSDSTDQRSSSPFSFLRKTNRDSKASTGNMLDNSSNKSGLTCSRKLLLIVALTLVLILVISVAVGLVAALTGK